MGLSLKKIFNDNEEELVVDKNKRAIRTLVYMCIGVAIALLIAWGLRASEILNRSAIRRDKIIQDAKVIQEAIKVRSNDHRIDGKVELLGIDLTKKGVTINVNGVVEEYRYGYYMLDPEALSKLTSALNLKDEYYIVNYDTFDVINHTGVAFKNKRYYSLEDLLIVEKGDAPQPKQIIRTVADLDKIRSNPNGYFKLSGNIDLSDYSNGEGWQPIEQFSGTIDGRGYTISNLKILRPSAKNVGFFGELLSSATIVNLNFEGVDVTGGEFVGALAGTNAGNISYVYVNKGTVDGATNHTGGLIGAQTNGMVSNCVVKLDLVASDTAVGGIVGSLYAGTLSKSGAVCNIRGTEKAGGAIGEVSIKDAIYIQEVCANTTITGKKSLGGIVGEISTASDKKLDFANSYAKGTIIGTNTNSGGLIGYITSVGDANMSFKAMYAAVDILEKANTSGGCIGYTDIASTSPVSLVHIFWEKDLAPGEVLRDVGAQANNTFTFSFDSETPEEMKIRVTFANWDFDIWGIEERVAMPYLKWEKNEKYK